MTLFSLMLIVQLTFISEKADKSPSVREKRGKNMCVCVCMCAVDNYAIFF